ncbi:hypothetical protein ASB7_10070 [Helicobacter ailurogastricus]|nr:hypothetical protein ASB7_10070 [Helicobacter ailurogastricus]
MSGIPLKDLALELGRTDVKMVIEEAKELLGLSLKPNSKLDEETASKLYDLITSKNTPPTPKAPTKKEPAPKAQEIQENPSAPKLETKQPQTAPKKRSIEIVSTGEKPKKNSPATPKKVQKKIEKVEKIEVRAQEPKPQAEATPTPPPPSTTHHRAAFKAHEGDSHCQAH